MNTIQDITKIRDMVIVQYQGQRDIIKTYAMRKIFSKDECLGMLKQNFRWFNTLNMLGYGYTYSVEQNLKVSTKEVWYDKDYGEPIYLLVYRDYIQPVYLDNAGQQEVMLYKNTYVSGGAYNDNAIQDFICYLNNLEFQADIENVEELFK